MGIGQLWDPNYPLRRQRVLPLQCRDEAGYAVEIRSFRQCPVPCRQLRLLTPRAPKCVPGLTVDYAEYDAGSFGKQ